VVNLRPLAGGGRSPDEQYDDGYRHWSGNATADPHVGPPGWLSGTRSGASRAGGRAWHL